MNKRQIIILIISAVLLMIPLVAMQLTDEVNWTLFDFLIAGALLIGTGLIGEFGLRKIIKTKYQIAFSVFLLLVLILTWVELAVGIFGTAFGGQ